MSNAAVLCAARGAADPVQCVLDAATPGKISGVTPAGSLLYVRE